MAGFVCLLSLPFLGKAYHNDESFFLAAAKHVLSDPLRPLDFNFTWYGRVLPACQINTTPPVLFYLMAFAMKLTGGGEWAMRLALLPLDLLAALALYLLAARFLSRPLLPALIVIASPAYLINMNYLMPEKPAAAFGFSALYCLVRGVDEESPGWFRLSAALLGAAILSKYLAILFLLPAAAYCLDRGVLWRRLGRYFSIALTPLAGLLAFYYFLEPAVLHRVWSVTSESAASWWSGWAHKLRSFLAFTGGCGVVTAFWPFLAMDRPRRWLAAVCAGVAGILFLPALDLAPLVRWVDRLTGLLFSCGALAGFWFLFAGGGRKAKGWALWGPWALSVGLLQLCLYWSVMSRIILFLIPPMVFAMAESLESRWKGSLRLIYGTSLSGVLVLSLALAWVDFRYAAAQKSFAREIQERYLAAGKKVWFTGYMGLQYYLERAGAEGLDASRGGWKLAKSGDVVVMLKINSAHLPPPRKILSNVKVMAADCWVPLRLISGWTGEGGFYSNVWGFLPYSLSREPLEEFTVVEVL